MNKIHIIYRPIPPYSKYVAALPVESTVCDKLQTAIMFDETKYILSYGSADNAIVKFTPIARNVCLLPLYTLENAYATRQLHGQ